MADQTDNTNGNGGQQAPQASAPSAPGAPAGGAPGGPGGGQDRPSGPGGPGGGGGGSGYRSGPRPGGGGGGGFRSGPRPGGGGGPGGRPRGRGDRYVPRRKVCSFCVDRVVEIDYKDVARLRRYLSERSKIEPRRKTGTCARHQRGLSVAIKRARHMALLPYVGPHAR